MEVTSPGSLEGCPLVPSGSGGAACLSRPCLVFRERENVLWDFLKCCGLTTGTVIVIELLDSENLCILCLDKYGRRK